ncbi:MAG TPA: TadE/TadG family type IV pilus assembly protein [Actinomycetota bacterium]|nr:TadE/TadG family type IV pilus assembly protein [Actinomycetota bacterium]
MESQRGFRSIRQREDDAGQGRRGLGSRGSAALEFALVIPMVVMLVLGVVDFGNVYNQWAGLRSGVAAGARFGSVANFGATSACPLTFVGGTAPSADLQNLMCLVKSSIGLPQSGVRIDVLISDPTLSTTGTAWLVGGGLTLCAEYPVLSVTGAFGSAFGGHYLRSKTTIRIEQAASQVETQGAETDPSGSGWAWCTPYNSGP